MKFDEIDLPIENKLFGIKTAMKLLGIKSRPTIYKLMAGEKPLPYRRMGNRRMFTIEDILDFQNKIRVIPER